MNAPRASRRFAELSQKKAARKENAARRTPPRSAAASAAPPARLFPSRNFAVLFPLPAHRIVTLLLFLMGVSGMLEYRFCDPANADGTPAQDVDDLIYGDTPAPPSDRVAPYI
jgi:hypothetical protein